MNIRYMIADEYGHDTDNMIREIVPPRPGQTRTLVLSRSHPRLRHLWDLAREAIDRAGPYTASPLRMELSTRNGSLRFINVGDVTQVAGFECEALAIDNITAFNVEEIAYLRRLVRSTSDFRPFIVATK